MNATAAAPVSIVVMAGDGIGPEIIAATMEVLGAAERMFKLGLSFTPVANIRWRGCMTRSLPSSRRSVTHHSPRFSS